MRRVDELLDRYFREILNRGDFAGAEEIFAEEFVFYGPSITAGLDSSAFARYVMEMRAAFSNKEFTELDRLVDGERAAIRFRMTGLQDGPYRGLPVLGG